MDERKSEELPSELDLRFRGKIIARLAVQAARETLQRALREVMEACSEARAAGFVVVSEELDDSYRDLQRRLQALGEVR